VTIRTPQFKNLGDGAKSVVKTFKGWHADSIYLTDNGAAYCGEHLGSSARTTGRDISGQRIVVITEADKDWWVKHNTRGNAPFCETCKKTWTRIGDPNG